MEVEVKLISSFRTGRFKSKRFILSDETKITDILDSLDIKKEELGFVLINGKYSNIDASLNDNDVLEFFPPSAGG
ncbi:MAG: MoaD/ThiS family protein [Clostridiaceae bacterium]|jgi:molybdopterin converting factor small subunit|nr:MoaD/ThiS family protein [Clostridiaceae bacterium]